MQKFYFLIAFLAVNVISQAQNNSLGNNDPSAKAILDKVSAKFKTFKGCTIRF